MNFNPLIINTMSTLATPQTFKRRGSSIFLNKQEYIGFPVGNLPKRFGFIFDAENEKDGITQWFNRGGLTFINKELL